MRTWDSSAAASAARLSNAVRYAAFRAEYAPRVDELLKSGETCKAIAQRIGIHHDTVRRIARELGYTPADLRQIANRAFGEQRRRECAERDRERAPIVLAMIRERKTFRQIADALGVNKDTVSRIARSRGVTKEQTMMAVALARSPYSEETIERIVRLYVDRRLSVAAIADALDMVPATVWKILNREIKLRDKSTGHRITVNNPETQRGQLKRDRTRAVVEMRHFEKLSFNEIGRRLGIARSTAQRYYDAAYAKARIACVYGDARQAERREHAIAMDREQGLPSAFIAKVIDIDVVTVERWLRQAAVERERAERIGIE